MRRLQFVTSLDELAARDVGRVLLLYSGGLDGSYFLDWAAAHGVRVTVLHVRLDHSPGEQVAKRARQLGADCIVHDACDAFFARYLPAAIYANAYYQSLYPIASSLSRPLFAEVTAEIACDRGFAAVAHTSTYMQNTAARLTLSLAALDPGLVIVAPFLRSDVPRSDKLATMRARGLSFPSGIYSIDENPWARVIECGTLEDPELPLPPRGVFTWTRDPNECPRDPDALDLDFHEGLPIALDDQRLGLEALTRELIERGGKHGVGRFSGLEETAFGVKNHEVREAPAAQILTTAHRELEAAVLSESELALKLSLDNHWTNLVVAGHWHSHLARCLAGFSEAINRPITGRVRLELYRGNVRVLAKRAPAGLYYARFQHEFADLMARFSFPEAYHLMCLPALARADLDGATGVPGADRQAGRRLAAAPAIS